jgi:hypothetical protein
LNQSVVTDCSHLFVFAAWDTYTADRINKMFDLTNTIRDMKNEGWENRQMLLNSYPQKMLKKNFNHAANRRTLHLHKQLLLLLSKKLTLPL